MFPNLGSGRISRLGTSRRQWHSAAFHIFNSVEEPRNTRSSTRSPSRATPLTQTAIKPPWDASFRISNDSVLILDTLRIERAAHRMVTNAREILHTSTTNQDDGVLLKVVPFTTDVRNNLRKPFVRRTLQTLRKAGIEAFWRRGVNSGCRHHAFVDAIFRRELCS